MIAVVCTLLSAAAFYFSLGIGTQWWLVWIAPVPVLWLAYGETKGWVALAASWLAFALGAANLLRAYAGIIPGPALLFYPIVPGFFFALAVVGSRQARHALGPVPALLTFATLWSAFDLLMSLHGAAGSIASPATAEVAAPVLVQGASVVGFCGVTFLIGAVSAGLALGLRGHRGAPVVLALALFAANAAYGYWRISTPATGRVRVALIDSDATMGPHLNPGAPQKQDDTAELASVDSYAAQIQRLRGRGVQLVVLPENISQIASSLQSVAQAKLAAAAEAAGAVVVAGFGAKIDDVAHNVAWAFDPGARVVGVQARSGTRGIAQRSWLGDLPGYGLPTHAAS